MDNCIFCKIMNRELPSQNVFETESVLVFKTIKPVAEYHYLVVPKKHVKSFMELGDDIKDMKDAAQEVIKQNNIASGYKLIFNGGKYQEVMHIHWHLLAGKLEDNDDILNQL